jgi:hypothetical protein
MLSVMVPPEISKAPPANELPSDDKKKRAQMSRRTAELMRAAKNPLKKAGEAIDILVREIIRLYSEKS